MLPAINLEAMTVTIGMYNHETVYGNLQNLKMSCVKTVINYKTDT